MILSLMCGLLSVNSMESTNAEAQIEWPFYQVRSQYCKIFHDPQLRANLLWTSPIDIKLIDRFIINNVQFAKSIHKYEDLHEKIKQQDTISLTLENVTPTKDDGTSIYHIHLQCDDMTYKIALSNYDIERLSYMRCEAEMFSDVIKSNPDIDQCNILENMCSVIIPEIESCIKGEEHKLTNDECDILLNQIREDLKDNLTTQRSNIIMYRHELCQYSYETFGGAEQVLINATKYRLEDKFLASKNHNLTTTTE